MCKFLFYETTTNESLSTVHLITALQNLQVHGEVYFVDFINNNMGLGVGFVNV